MFKKCLSLILFSIIISSCSMTGIFVGKLDYYVAKKTSSRLNLYLKQEDKLHIDIEKLFDSAKPEVKIIQSLINTFPKKELRISQTFLSEFINQFKIPFKGLIKKSTILLAQYLTAMSVNQQKLFLADLAKKNKKASRSLKKNNYFENVSDRFEMLLGSLNSKQKLVIKKYRYTYKRWQQKKLKVNLFFESQLKQAFKIKDENERKLFIEKNSMKSVTMYMEILQGPVFNEIIKSYFLVLKSSTKEQRKTLESKIDFINKVLTSFIKIKYSN